MKKNVLFYSKLFLICSGSLILSGNVALAQSSTLSADGVYVPKLTAAQRNDITSPVNGQMVYNTDDNCFNVYQKNTWQKLCGFDMETTETWTKKADFGGSSRFGAVGFSIDNKGYIGTGYDGGLRKDFWEYDPVKNTWTQKADFAGVARDGGIGFSIGNKGYVGTGFDGGYKKDFWEYDPVGNIWTQKADFGGSARSSAVGFSIDNKGYVGTGAAAEGFKKDFWEYDPAGNTWKQRPDFGGFARANAVGFSMPNKGYIGTGDTQSGILKDFWEFNPSDSIWTQKADFGGEARWHAVGFSINSKGYIGTGLTSWGYSKDFWEYDYLKNQWTKKADIGGVGNHMGVGFSINSEGYVGLGSGVNGFRKDFWEYKPEESITKQGNTFNGIAQLVKTDGSGKIPTALLSANITTQGNTFNGNTQLVKTDGSGKIPTGVLPGSITSQGNTFNGANQLAKLDASGFLGVGVASPKALIHLANSVTNRKIILWQNEVTSEHYFFGFGINDKELRYQVDASHSSHVFYAGNDESASTELFRIKGSGGACLNGNMVTTGASCTSDIRYKRNFSSIANPLDKILQMNGFQYYWKTEQFKEKNFPESRQIGFIAQEVEALFPELVNTDEKGYKSVDYARLTPVLVEAIKELKKENNAIRKDIELLKNLVLQAHNGK